MSHYHISIPVSKEEVKVVKEQLSKYLEESTGIHIHVSPEIETEEVPEELQDVIRLLFIRLVMLIDMGQFEGLH